MSKKIAHKSTKKPPKGPLVRIKDTKMMPITKLVLHPKNPNVHSPEQIEALAALIEFQGWRLPIKVSTRSGFVTSGHGRIEAAKLRGWTQVPVSRQDYDSEAQEYADVVADNAIAEWAILDLGRINTDIIELGPDFDIKMLGIKNFVLDPSEISDVEINEKELDENISTEKECPSCGYKW